MNNPAFFYDDWQERAIIIPTLAVDTFTLVISTRTGSFTVDWGDGTKNVYNPTKNSENPSSITKNYSTRFTGNIKLFATKGLEDVYFWRFSIGAIQQDFKDRINVPDIKTFLDQFPNLYSVYWEVYGYFVGNRQSILRGSFADVPVNLKRLTLGSLDVTGSRATFDLGTFPINSQLENLTVTQGTGNSGISPTGDLAKIPAKIKNLVISRTAGSYIYTPGRIWVNQIETINIARTLTTAIIDNILIDVNNSGSLPVGSLKSIILKGSRSTASDSSVASLQAKGFTISIST